MKTTLPKDLFESLCFYTAQRDATLARIARNVVRRGAFIEQTEDSKGRTREWVVRFAEAR